MAYKHFSHHHDLTFQQLQQTGAPEIQCSGCKSSGSGSVYICWQCSFFLHEQCFRASRSVKHPSHPSHPLTLVPYPTHPSGSFICDSCNQTGTGFSYTCANCEFDLHVQCAYMYQTITHESYPHVHYLQHAHANQMPGFYNPYMPQHATHDSYSAAPNQNYSLLNSTATFNAHSSHMPQSSDTHDPYTNVPNPNHSLPSITPNFNSQYSYKPETAIHESVPNETMPTFDTKISTKAPSQANKANHFSHHHCLHLSEIQEEDGIVCSGCEQELSGSAYSCTEKNCNFNLHKACLELPKQIQHKSHPEHPLILLSSPPYIEEEGFTCNACLQKGTAFTYHCSTCKFDLHVDCTSMPEIVKREDHKHPLALLYSPQYKEDGNELIFVCDVCGSTVDDRCWLYCCKLCDFGAHLHCVATEKRQEEELSAVSLLAAQLQRQAQLQRLQLQIQMSQQTANSMLHMGAGAQLVSNMCHDAKNSI